MFPLYLRPTGDVTKFSDGGVYEQSSPFAAPDGFEWVEGEPPVDAIAYIQPSLLSQLEAIFQSQSLALQIAFAGVQSLTRDYAEKQDWATVKSIIGGVPIPAELAASADPVKQQLLAVLNAV